MAKNAPGKHYRKGISLLELFQQFPDDSSAEQWFIAQRWPNGPVCPKCESSDVSTTTKHKTMPFHCRQCRRFFSVKTGSIMEGSKLPYQKWLIAVYCLTTRIKGVSSMELHRAINVTQKTAWYLAHRIRESWATSGYAQFTGPVEVDETYIGGKVANMHAWKRPKSGRGVANKQAVIGILERQSNQVMTQPIGSTNAQTLQLFVHSHTHYSAQVYTDEHPSYENVWRQHESVKHSAGEYVKGDVHTSGIESHWALFKRGLNGTYHHVSRKHLHRYNNEFAGRHNIRPKDTADQMTNVVTGMKGKRMRYLDLIGPKETRIHGG